VAARGRPNPALVEQVHRALRCANQVLSARLRRSLRRAGLPFSRFAILRLVIVRGPATSKALAETLGVTSANMPALIDRLEADGLVSRTRNTEDRREILIAPTPKGRRTFGRFRSTASEELLQAFDGWSENEIRSLLKSLERFMGPWRAADLTELTVVR
jgi:DNA-binding MarR family transcriptional regulator